VSSSPVTGAWVVTRPANWATPLPHRLEPRKRTSGSCRHTQLPRHSSPGRNLMPERTTSAPPDTLHQYLARHHFAHTRQQHMARPRPARQPCCTASPPMPSACTRAPSAQAPSPPSSSPQSEPRSARPQSRPASDKRRPPTAILKPLVRGQEPWDGRSVYRSYRTGSVDFDGRVRASSWPRATPDGTPTYGRTDA
jgi:hypothetical protein